MTNISSQTANLSPDIINHDVQRFGNIKTMKSPKAQLEKVSREFEAIFVTKMLNTMDKTVNKEDSVFGNDDKYMDKFKTFIYDEIGRDIANNPRTSIGFAKQIYAQMERYLPKEESESQNVVESTKHTAHAASNVAVKKAAETVSQTAVQNSASIGYAAEQNKQFLNKNENNEEATVFENTGTQEIKNRVDKEI